MTCVTGSSTSRNSASRPSTSTTLRGVGLRSRRSVDLVADDGGTRGRRHQHHRATDLDAGRAEPRPGDHPLEVRARRQGGGLDIITWTLERSGSLGEGGGWYYRTISEAIDNDGDMLVLLDVLARQVGIRGIFSDWPATVTYYANCMGLE